MTIGEFSRKTGLSARAIRLYERKGLLSSERTENKYRRYGDGDLRRARRIVRFKELGFRLDEIKALLESRLDTERLRSFMAKRLSLIAGEESSLRVQRREIESILSSLKRKSLNGKERRYVMSLFQNVSIVVTGGGDLELTARYIRQHLRRSGQEVPIVAGVRSPLPPSKPYIVTVPEDELAAVEDLRPDVVVIRRLGDFSETRAKAYLRLYQGIGPHMATVLNADEMTAIEFAKLPTVQKGKIFYFSKNAALRGQISRIGGSVSDGEEIRLFGWNHRPEEWTMPLKKALSFDHETALMASLTAVMDIGLAPEALQPEESPS